MKLTSFRQHAVFDGIASRKMAAERYKVVLIRVPPYIIDHGGGSRYCIIPSLTSNVASGCFTTVQTHP